MNIEIKQIQHRQLIRSKKLFYYFLTFVKLTNIISQPIHKLTNRFKSQFSLSLFPKKKQEKNIPTLQLAKNLFSSFLV